MSTQPNLVSIFGEAYEIESPAERAAFLNQACSGDAALRGRVEALLAAGAGVGSTFMEPEGAAPSENDIGTAIGPYTLLEKLGEGGMGAVYKAEQTEPVRRIVALKLIKAGLNSAKVVARFEAERQALAMMDHENIARVYDGGITPAGQPYFVMELVEGVPLTAYCDKTRVPLRTRLELFVQVCKAIQHAHQKGVIHRDIKPSNVLVTIKDGKPIVKVIDFGVAKALNQKLTDDTQMTLQARSSAHWNTCRPNRPALTPQASTPAATFIRWACCCTNC